MKHTKFVGAFVVLLMLVGFMPMGCSNTVGSVRVTETTKASRSNYPDRTVERFQECVTEHAAQLGPGNHALDATMDMDEDGLRYNVEIANLPPSGDEFGACMRSALQDMAISERLLDDAREKLKVQREQALAEQKKLMGSPVVVVVGVTVVVTEVFLEAGAITILFATTVTLIDKAAKDVAELARRKRKDRCTDYYEKCVESSLWRQYGRHEWDSLCSLCASVCFANNGTWPSMVGVKDCNYQPGKSN